MELEAAEKMARQMMDEHGLEDWKFVFDWGMNTLGQCDYEKRQLSLSRYVTPLNDEEDVKLTVLHEIAHAKAGHAAGHGWRWRQLCLSIGGDGKQYCVEPHVKFPVGRWKGVCPNGHVHRMHCRPTCKKSCRFCSTRYDESLLLTWTDEGFDPGRVATLAQQMRGEL